MVTTFSDKRQVLRSIAHNWSPQIFKGPNKYFMWRKIDHTYENTLLKFQDSKIGLTTL